MKKWFVYIITNKYHSVLYTGVTSRLKKRIYEHKHWVNDGFSKRYHLCKLVWYGEFSSILEAIMYEKTIKWWTRKKKIYMIQNSNPYRYDLLPWM